MYTYIFVVYAHRSMQLLVYQVYSYRYANATAMLSARAKPLSLLRSTLLYYNIYFIIYYIRVWVYNNKFVDPHHSCYTFIQLDSNTHTHNVIMMGQREESSFLFIISNDENKIFFIRMFAICSSFSILFPSLYFIFASFRTIKQDNIHK